MEDIKELIDKVQFTDANWVLLLPCALMALDVLTGVVHAWATGHLKSYRMREGLGRKAGEISVLIVGCLLVASINLPMYILSGASIYIIVMELISVCENLDKLGVPIPKFVKKALGKAKDIIQNESKVGDDEDESDDSDNTDK